MSQVSIRKSTSETQSESETIPESIHVDQEDHHQEGDANNKASKPADQLHFFELLFGRKETESLDSRQWLYAKIC